MLENNPKASSVRHAVELLAPAKNLEIGKAAINAGADAVYIGGPAFGARAAAGNSLEDLQVLCSYAHRFGAKVYVTLNTLLFEHELSQAQSLVASLVELGADALIVQDPAILTFEQTKNIEIHASTQWNINSLAKVDSCIANNISQIVLPREFDLETIKHFCQSRPQVKFEVFVSGAMCVSVSGICYISELMTKRSANRGECAQICRLPMQLYRKDSNNQEKIIASGHLLSMKDNQRLDYLESLVLAGTSSFKIEGRLKDHDFVVNQVSAFNQRLNAIIRKYPEHFVRSSLGKTVCNFVPNLSKTFNRGFTNQYMLNDNSNLVDVRTPKSLGESMGQVLSCQYCSIPSNKVKYSNRGVQGRNFKQSVATEKPTKSFIVKFKAQKDFTLNNGDSFTFFDGTELSGFRINRATLEDFVKVENELKVNKGQVVCLWLNKEVPALKAKAMLYRNVDTFFIKQIQMPKATERKLELNAKLELKEVEANVNTLILTFSDQFKRQGQAIIYLNSRSLDQEQVQNLNALFNQELESQEQGIKDLYEQELQFTNSAINQGTTLVNKFKQWVNDPKKLEFFTTNCPLLAVEVVLDKLTKLNDPTLSLDPNNIQCVGNLSSLKLPLSIFNKLRRLALIRYQCGSILSRVQSQVLNSLYLGKDPSLNVYTQPDHFASWPEKEIDPRLIQNSVTQKWYQSVLDPQGDALSALNAKSVMTCRHCLVKAHAVCKKDGGSTRGFSLQIGKHNFDIVCDCKECLMHLVARS